MKTVYFVAILLVTALAVEKTKIKKDFLGPHKTAKATKTFIASGQRVVGEWGTVYFHTEWQEFRFENSYKNPVVVLGPPSGAVGDA